MGMLGDDRNDDKITILGRTVEWTDTGIRFHADPKRREMFLKSLGLDDGFKGLVMLNCKYDAVTRCSLLRNYLEVVAPPPITKVSEIESGIEVWEGRVVKLETKHRQVIGNELRVAILLGMLPKEYQDKVFDHLLSGRRARRSTMIVRGSMWFPSTGRGLR